MLVEDAMMAAKDPGLDPTKMTPEEFYQWIQPRGARLRTRDLPAEAADVFAGEIRVTPVMDLLPARKAERRRRRA